LGKRRREGRVKLSLKEDSPGFSSLDGRRKEDYLKYDIWEYIDII
jgi:hypothetical protein